METSITVVKITRANEEIGRARLAKLDANYSDNDVTSARHFVPAVQLPMIRIAICGRFARMSRLQLSWSKCILLAALSINYSTV